SLRAFDHAIVLRRPRRIPGHVHAQADQPQRQLRGPIAFRSPGSAVIDAETLRPTPPRKNQAQRLLHERRLHQAPEALGGKSWSARQPHCIHPPHAANSLVGRLPSLIDPRRPFAKRRAGDGRAVRRWRGAGRAAPAECWTAETTVARFARWGKHCCPLLVAKRESNRRPRWGVAVACLPPVERSRRRSEPSWLHSDHSPARAPFGLDPRIGAPNDAPSAETTATLRRGRPPTPPSSNGPELLAEREQE